MDVKKQEKLFYDYMESQSAIECWSGNYNRATRDEQIAEHAFLAGLEQGMEEQEVNFVVDEEQVNSVIKDYQKIAADRANFEKENEILRKNNREACDGRHEWMEKYADLNAKYKKLFECVNKMLMPCEMYKAYGWDDRGGVIKFAKECLEEMEIE